MLIVGDGKLKTLESATFWERCDYTLHPDTYIEDTKKTITESLSKINQLENEEKIQDLFFIVLRRANYDRGRGIMRRPKRFCAAYKHTNG